MHNLQFAWVHVQAVRSLRRTLLSDMPNAGACLGADRLGLRPTDANTRAIFSGVRTEDGRAGGFLHETEPSSHQSYPSTD
jgi:hypothetical protein